MKSETKVIEITENHIDIHKILAAKGVNVSRSMVQILNRLLHVSEMNAAIYNHRDKFGIDFAQAFLEGDLNIATRVMGGENIPLTGNPIIAGNHPLGGPDGLALLNAVGRYRRDLLFPVNDFLMHLPELCSVFVPIDKVNHSFNNVAALQDAFAGNNTLLYFPAGLCSRRQHGKIRDLDWKPTFIKQAVRHHRDIVPFFFDARNRNRFYTIANLRKLLGIKFNFEMALLPAEMFAQRNHTFNLIVGKPIPYNTFDLRHTPTEWAEMLRQYIYRLQYNPNEQFITD